MSRPRGPSNTFWSHGNQHQRPYHQQNDFRPRSNYHQYSRPRNDYNQNPRPRNDFFQNPRPRDEYHQNSRPRNNFFQNQRPRNDYYRPRYDNYQNTRPWSDRNQSSGTFWNQNPKQNEGSGTNYTPKFSSEQNALNSQGGIQLGLGSSFQSSQPLFNNPFQSSQNVSTFQLPNATQQAQEDNMGEISMEQPINPSISNPVAPLFGNNPSASPLFQPLVRPAMPLFTY